MRYVPFGDSQDPDDVVTPYASTGETTVDREIEAYLQALSLRTTSADTRRTKSSQLRAFQRWCVDEGVHELEQLTRDVVNRYLLERQGQGLSPNSIAVSGFSIKGWLLWLYDQGFLQRVPRFETPRSRIKLPRTLAPEQVAAIVRACEDGTPLGFRDRAIVEFLYGTGCRVSELHKLDLDDLNLQERRAMIHGKGDRTRVAVLTVRAAEALRVYLERFRVPIDVPFHARAVFVSRNGRRMLRNAIWSVVCRRGARAKVPNVHPHLFRHSFATHFHRKSKDLLLVQRLLGHADVSSTQIYTHLDTEDLERGVAAHHPRP
jgi:integrase/recombinase XerD